MPQSHTSFVVSGFGRGGKMGIPTINLRVPSDLQDPHGIYAGRLLVNDSQYPAAVHFGHVPTFDQASVSLEFMLLVPPTDVPVLPVETAVQFVLVKKIREIRLFDTVAALQQQVAEDTARIRQILGLLG